MVVPNPAIKQANSQQGPEFDPALGTLIFSVVSFRISSRRLIAVAAAVQEVHVATNSLQDKLVAEVRSAEHAKGLKEGRAEK